MAKKAIKDAKKPAKKSAKKQSKKSVQRASRTTVVDIILRDADFREAFNITSKAKGMIVVNKVIDAMQTAINENDRLCLTGFGSFVKTTRAARKFKTPQGVEVNAPCREVLRFKESKYSADDK